MTGASAQQEAEQQLDGFAAELEALGFREFTALYMPHRVGAEVDVVPHTPSQRWILGPRRRGTAARGSPALRSADPP